MNEYHNSTQIKPSCNINCTVNNLSQLIVCQLDSCTYPPIRCINCYKTIHYDIDGNGKKITHTSRKFNQSSLYKNFYYLVKIFQIVAKKVYKMFGYLNQNLQVFAFQFFNTLQFKKKILHPQQFMTQFYLFKQLFYKRPVTFFYSPTTQFANTLKLITQKTLTSTKNSLIQPTQQQILMSLCFNQISSSSPQFILKFIAQQQQQFTKYCDEIRQKQTDFYIEDYVKIRSSSSKNNSLFSLPFQNFISEKYEDKPSEQSLFTPAEYFSYMWSNLQSISLNPQIQSYLNSWILLYTQYLQSMLTKNLQPTLLSYRMWKQQMKLQIPPIITQIKYFLDNFILAYIDVLINNLYDVVPTQANNWKQFIKYLKDYQHVTKLKGQLFSDISKYVLYYEFRHKNQGLIQYIQKSDKISFNRLLCIQYLNNTYKDGSQSGVKGYQKFLLAKQKQTKQNQIKFQQISINLQNQQEKEEGNKFYLIVFNDYLKQCMKNKETPTKQHYIEFKKHLLEQVDEQGIILQNDKLLLQQKQLKQQQQKNKQLIQQQKQKQQKQQQQKLPPQQKPQQKLYKIDLKIDQAQQNFVQIQKQFSSDNQQQNITFDCPCCNGHPQNCNAPQCQMMGYCVTCTL